jgi:cation diffusion facilitator family transporter
MHSHSMQQWTHDHVFLGRDHARNERRTWFVVALTALMMVAEIVAGIAFGSMALLADGVHMLTHAGALGIAAGAYVYARRRARDPSFSFGTGKVGDLASFASAIILAMMALAVGYESAVRLYAPVVIHFDEAIPIAVIGLAANLISAVLLKEGHTHRHDDGDRHAHHNGHAHRDHNLRSTYVHVLADAATSVLAIAALLAGRFFGLSWLDPVIGIAGAVLIGHWSIGLMRSAGAVLTDAVTDPGLEGRIRERLEAGDDRVADLHLWRVGPGHAALVVTIVSDEPRPPDHYKRRLGGLPGLSHVTVEVQRCPHASETAA